MTPPPQPPPHYLFPTLLGGNGASVTHWNKGEQNIRELKGQSGSENYALAMQLWSCCKTPTPWRLGFSGVDAEEFKDLHLLFILNLQRSTYSWLWPESFGIMVKVTRQVPGSGSALLTKSSLKQANGAPIALSTWQNIILNYWNNQDQRNHNVFLWELTPADSSGSRQSEIWL